MITFQEMLRRLSHFWEKQGCIIHQPYDLEKGAGTFNPATFLRALGPEPYRAAYIEPCRRPKDGRYGTNPNRVQHYFQYQVLLKPSPPNILDLYLKSLEAIGFDLSQYDVRFVHDDWEGPTLGAWGLGWEVWINGMECTQFTYFQSVAGFPLSPVSGEITYGTERLAMYLQGVNSMFDIQWNEEMTYGDIYRQNEVEMSHYNFEQADAQMWLKHFEDYARETKRLIECNLPLPAYDFVMKASHAFNLLDARGVISVTERASYIARIRELACGVAKNYIEMRESLNFPLLGKFNSPYMETSTILSSNPHIPSSSNYLEDKKDFLLEIGVEELPAHFVTIGCQNLENAMKSLLKKEDLHFDSIKTYGTPRRLAVLIKDLDTARKAQETEKRGPALEQAFLDNGELSPAGKGFIRSIGKEELSLSDLKTGKNPDLYIKEVKNIAYIFGKQRAESISTQTILSQTLPHLILSLDFPKKMRWEDLEFSFARPIRWIVSLLGEDIIPFSIGPVSADRNTYGHRLLANCILPLANATSYVEQLKSDQLNVLVDIDERRREIKRQLHELCQKHQCSVISEDKVIPQVLNLVEWPYLTLTEFDPKFLSVPQEVLISEMVEHQKYFPVANSDGSLKNAFIITANIPPTDSVRSGNLKVLSARLEDGVFLYTQDLKTPLEQFNEKLKNIIFQNGLGTVYDKILRLKQHAHIIARFVKEPVDPKKLERAVWLCKSDLATEMVHEFDELQGQIGRIYALKQNEPEDVAAAIDEHWMPRGEHAPLPQTLLGTIISLADKADNLLGFFGLDLKPSSSSDPYALRRQALGLVKIILNKKINLSLRKFLEECLEAFPTAIHSKGKSLIDEVIAFIFTRARTVFLDLGFAKDEIESCLKKSDDLLDLFERLSALKKFRISHANFPKLVEVYKRCRGQLHSAKVKTTLFFDSQLLHEEQELSLYRSLQAIDSEYSRLIKSHHYLEAFERLVSLQQPLSDLFLRVKILADDERIRNNRLALLQHVLALFEQIAEFNELQEQ